MKPIKFTIPPIPIFDKAAAFLNARNAREKYMLIGLIGVGLFVVDYFVWLSPVLQAYSAVAPKIAPLRDDLKQLREDRKNKDAIFSKWELAKKELTEKERLFVAADETPALLENLSRQAQKSGVRLTSLEPFDGQKAPTKGSSYTPLPIQIKAAAGTHEFGALLSSLETGSTFFRVKDLRIASNPLNERKHSIELSMEAYKREK